MPILTDDSVDYVDYARFAKLLQGGSCPVCKAEWLCPKDVCDRKPQAIGDEIVCAKCLKPSSSRVSEYIEYCLSRSDELSSGEEALVIRISTLSDGELSTDEYRRIRRVVERIKERGR